MKYNGKIINKDKFKEIVCDLCDKDTIDVSYLKEAEMPYEKKVYQNKDACVFSVHIRQYNDILVFRYFTRTDLYTNKVKDGLNVKSSFIREVERFVMYGSEKYLLVNGVSTFMGGFRFYSELSDWNITSYTRTYASYYGNGRKYDFYLSYYEANILDKPTLSNALSSLKRGYCGEDIELALYNSSINHKYEVALLNGFAGCISDIDTYSEKQIAFACRNHIADRLPLMKYFQTYDIQFLSAFKKDDWWTYHHQSYEDVIETCGILEKHNIDKFRYIAFVRQFDKNSFDYSLFYDYVKMLDFLDTNFKGKVVFKKDYKEAHDVIQKSYILFKQQDLINKENKKYCEVADKLMWIDRTEDYSVVVPKDVSQFLIEGNENNICVFSAKYYQKVYNHKSIIVFIRENEKVDKPYVCMELNYNTFDIIQIRGKSNCKPNSDVLSYADKLILDLKKEAQERMWC